jgi:hypothetical protein
MPIWYPPPQPQQRGNTHPIASPVTLTLSADTLLLKGFTKGVSADLKIRGANEVEIEADVLFQKLGLTKTITSDVLLQKALTKQITADTGLSKANVIITIPVDIRICKWQTSEISVTADFYILPTFVGDTVNFFFEYFVNVSAGVTLVKLDIDTTLAVDVKFDPPFWDKTLPVDVALQRSDIPKSILSDVLLKHLNAEETLPVDAYLYQAEPYDPPLETAQHLHSYTPCVIATFTKEGSPTYTHAWGAAIVDLEEHIDPFKHVAKIVLDNSDLALTNINFEGYQCVISWGIKVTTVAHYIASPPTWVFSQTYTSQEGLLTVTLVTKGAISMMDDDHASCKEISSVPYTDNLYPEYTVTPEPTQWDNKAGWTVRQWLDAICGATSVAYSHCKAYSTMWHNVGSGTNYTPDGAFGIYVNAKRSDAIRYLLDRTNIVMRAENDGILHFFVAGGDSYTYELLGDHTFFAKDTAQESIIPTGVTVYGRLLRKGESGYSETEENRHVGVCGGGEKMYYDTMAGLKTNGECAAVATAFYRKMLDNVSTAKVNVPMDCFRRIHDAITMIDVREGSTKYGNVGTIDRKFRPGYYRMDIGTGGWGDFNTDFYRDATGDAVRKSYPAPDTLSASLPDTNLNPQEFIWFATIRNPFNGGLLYIHSVNVTAREGTVELYIQMCGNADGTGYRECIGFPVTSPYGQKWETPKWVTATGYLSVPYYKYIRFGVKNNAAVEDGVKAMYVNASVNYDLRTFSQGLY